MLIKSERYIDTGSHQYWKLFYGSYIVLFDIVEGITIYSPIISFKGYSIFRNTQIYTHANEILADYIIIHHKQLHMHLDSVVIFEIKRFLV